MGPCRRVGNRRESVEGIPPCGDGPGLAFYHRRRLPRAAALLQWLQRRLLLLRLFDHDCREQTVLYIPGPVPVPLRIRIVVVKNYRVVLLVVTTVTAAEPFRSH